MADTSEPRRRLVTGPVSSSWRSSRGRTGTNIRHRDFVVAVPERPVIGDPHA
jgi:hypothetical protein